MSHVPGAFHLDTMPALSSRVRASGLVHDGRIELDPAIAKPVADARSLLRRERLRRDADHAHSGRFRDIHRRDDVIVSNVRIPGHVDDLLRPCRVDALELTW